MSGNSEEVCVCLVTVTVRRCVCLVPVTVTVRRCVCLVTVTVTVRRSVRELLVHFCQERTLFTAKSEFD